MDFKTDNEAFEKELKEKQQLKKLLKISSGFAEVESEAAADSLEAAADEVFSADELYTMIPTPTDDELDNLSSFNES